MGDFSIDYQDEADKEKDRVLREFLNAGPQVDVPQTRVEATGRAAQAEPDELEQALKARALAGINKPAATPTDRKMASGASWDVGIPSAAALVLDAFVNRGRGAGQIVGATANSIDADRRAEQERLDKIAEIEARNKDKDPLKAFVEYGNLQDRTKELGIRRQTADTTSTRLDSLVNPESEAAKGKLELTAEGAKARRGGLLEANHEAAPTTAEDAAAAEALKLRTTAPQRIADAGQIAGAQSEARQPYVEHNASVADERRAADEQRRAALGAEKPLTPQQTSQLADKYATENKFALDSAKHLMTLEGVVGKYKPGDIPGIGLVAGREPTASLATRDTMSDFINQPDQRVKDALKIRQLQSEMSNAVERAESGAAIGLKEDQKYLIREGAQPGASEEQFRQGVEAYKRTLQGRLTGYRVGKEDVADKVLASQGITPEWLGTNKPAQAASLGNGPPPAPDGGENDLAKGPPLSAGEAPPLPVTARAKPPGIPKGATSFTVVNRKTGKPVKQPLSEEDIALIKADPESPYAVVEDQ